MLVILVLICALFSSSSDDCSDVPNMTWSKESLSYSYQIFLNGKKTTWSQTAGWRASANIGGQSITVLRPDVPNTVNEVTTLLTVSSEDCNTVLVQWDLVNNGSEEKTVGVCVYADAYIIQDMDVWTLFPNHTGLYVNAPFYIKASEQLSGIVPGNNCNSSQFTLVSSDTMSFNWNNINLGANQTRRFQVRYANYESELCTLNNIKISYGPCINDSRDIVFYTTDCRIPDDGSFSIPPPLRNKTCNFSCPAGHYYDLTTNATNCTSCAAGKEADGFSVVYNNLTADDMSPFTTTCQQTDQSETGCKNWTVWGNYLTTGFQNTNVLVNLSLNVDIYQTTGEVLFEYTCPEVWRNSTEFFFYVDGYRMNNNYISDVWKADRYSLSFGAHKLLWVFNTTSSYNPSEIGARLRNVEIRGTKYLVTSCRGCPSGRTSVAGGQCFPCTFNTVPSNGTGECLQCPSTQYAYPGDFECQDRAPCVSTDYYDELGPCINNQQIVTKKLYTPVICLEETSPEPITTPCPKCDPGHYMKSGQCTACEGGTYRNSNMTDDKCVACPGGTYASKNDNNMRPSFIGNPFFSTGCVSDDRDINNCATEEGWLEEKTFITPGNHFGPVTVWLNRTILNTEWGSLFFSYTTRLRDDSYFKFYSDSYDYLMVNSTANDVKHNFTVYFSRGNHSFSWLFIKTCHNGCPKNDYSVKDTLEIDELSISPESVGGGTECTPCYPGYYAPEGSAVCEECIAGTYSENASAVCLPCPEGTYSNYNRSSRCKPCLNNTHPDASRSSCEFAGCGFQHNETFVFSLQALQNEDEMIRAITPNNETRLFFLDICTKSNSKQTCRDNWDAPDGGEETYACVVSTDSQDYRSSQLGREAEMNYFDVKNADDTVTKYGVNLTYSDGDYGLCEPLDEWLPMSIEILFICQPNTGVGELQLAPEFQDKTRNCRFQYEWVTEYACRICTRNDYRTIEGECKKGKRNTTTVIKDSQTVCTHGYTPNPWEISSCPNPLVKLSAAAVVGIVVAALVLLAVAIFFIVFYIRKNRALRYQLFQKSNFSLVDHTEEDAGADDAPSGTSMFSGEGQQQEEQYKSVDFSGMAQTADSAY